VAWNWVEYVHVARTWIPGTFNTARDQALVRSIVSRAYYAAFISAEGPCCAVGAGLIYAELQTTDYPLHTFVDVYDVPWEYACGVSDGFEKLSC
jgi:hypothetical protein